MRWRGGPRSGVRPGLRLAAACLLAAAVVAGYSAYAGHAPGGRAAPEVVEPGAILRYRRLYDGCGREEVGSGPVPLGLVGLNRAQVQRTFPDARILHFDRRLVEIASVVPGCAPGSAITAILRDGVVVAYYGTPGHLGRVYRVTRIRADRLMPQDRDRLAAGIVVHSPQALDRLIEGLAE